MYKANNVNLQVKQFTVGDHSYLQAELGEIKSKCANIPSRQRAEILISYLKNHSLSKELLIANPGFCRFIIEESSSTTQIEALFFSNRENPVFVQGLEKYIRESC